MRFETKQIKIKVSRKSVLELHYLAILNNLIIKVASSLLGFTEQRFSMGWWLLGLTVSLFKFS